MLPDDKFVESEIFMFDEKKCLTCVKTDSQQERFLR